MVFSKDWYERRKFVGVIIRINRVPYYISNNFFFLIIASIWVAEEVDLSKDKDDWANLSVSSNLSFYLHDT